MIIEDTAVKNTLPTVYLDRGYTYAQMENYDQAMVDFQWVLDNVDDKDQKCSVYELWQMCPLPKTIIRPRRTYSGMIECHPDDYLNYFSRGYYKELGFMTPSVPCRIWQSWLKKMKISAWKWLPSISWPGHQ
ncbi:MAG: hypothetical protein R3C61_12080 [Bacteroidia bacterium]